MDEEIKNEGQTTPTPSDYELTFNLPPLEGLTVEAGRKENLDIDADSNHPFWNDGKFHSAAVERKLAVQKIVTPGHTPVPGEISKKMELEKAGITEKDLQASDEAVRNLMDQENFDRAIKPLQAEWGPPPDSTKKWAASASSSPLSPSSLEGF
jgi:hypothetical protein